MLSKELATVTATTTIRETRTIKGIASASELVEKKCEKRAKL